MAKSQETKTTRPSFLDIREVGFVKEIKKGIARIEGLPNCIYGQLVQFSSGVKGMVIGFTKDEALLVIIGDENKVKVGDSVTSWSELLKVPVGDNFIGRIVNALCEPVDGKEEIYPSDYYSVFKVAAGVMEREPLNEALHTGIKMLDLTIPIGKGQRELILGDRQTGKTSIITDTILNQHDKNVICIYCWIGGSEAGLYKVLHNIAPAMPYTIVVSAPASSSAAEQYLAPYVAAALGEYFMDRGRDVFVGFDDLTKHAWIYRQISLLLERAPGREAYPGDIFFAHSQLVERAGKYNKARGSGSMTFFPIVETLQGDVTGYIQSNLISMTDGQVYLDAGLFHEGFKPAINLGLSVSRIGSKVQSDAIREVSGGLRLEYAQYREMLRLTKLRTKLSEEALRQLSRGEALRELLIQENNHPVSTIEQAIVFYAFSKKMLEILPGDIVKKFKAGIFEYLTDYAPAVLKTLGKSPQLSVAVKKELDDLFMKFLKHLETKEEQLA